jgi:hypothetical protein
MAITETALLARLVAVCEALGYTQAVGTDFTRQPNGAVDGRFTVALEGGAPIGGMNFTEEGRATAVVEVAKLINSDGNAVDAELHTAGRALINAVVRDGAQVSGEYAVEDSGRSMTILAAPGAAFKVLRCRIPLNYEATL